MLLRHVPGRAVARDRRDERPPVVRRGAVPPGTEVETVRAAPAVRGFRPGGRRAGKVGLERIHFEIAASDTSIVESPER